MDWLEKYGFMVVGVWLAISFFIAITFFVRRNSPLNDKPIGIGWYLLLGPFALLKWHAQRTQKKEVLNRREIGGWIFVIVLVIAVILWKLISKNL